jgi:hypothetical protein
VRYRERTFPRLIDFRTMFEKFLTFRGSPFS